MSEKIRIEFAIEKCIQCGGTWNEDTKECEGGLPIPVGKEGARFSEKIRNNLGTIEEKMLKDRKGVETLRPTASRSVPATETLR